MYMVEKSALPPMEFVPDSLDDEPSSPLTGYAPDSFDDERPSPLTGYAPDSFDDQPLSTPMGSVPHSLEDEVLSPRLQDVPDSLEDEPSSPPKEFMPKDQPRPPSPIMEFVALEGQLEMDDNNVASRFGSMPTDKTSLNLPFDEFRDRKREKRVINQLFKPSASVFPGQKANVRHRNQGRLRIVLDKLIRRRHWACVGGVISAFLQATSKERSLHNNYFKYSGAMEFLAHVEKGRAYSKDIEDIYNIWLSKIAPQKNRPLKDKCVLFDAIVTFLVEKNYDGARSAATCVKQDCGADNDGMSHLILGLFHYELWYTTLPKDRQLVDLHQQETSLRNDLFSPAGRERGKNHYDASGSEWSFKNINGVPDSLLFPVQWNPLNEKIEDVLKELKFNCDYKDAVDYLRKALNSTPRVEEALIPLVQLFLLKDRVTEAFDELQKFFSTSDTLFASRLKTHCFECLGCSSLEELCSSYEDILKKDPTCRHSVTRLIWLCQIGDYIPERLLEMIALYLEAAFGDHDIWREFASCMLKVCQSQEDRISTNLNGDAGGSPYQNKEIPATFIKGVQRDTWKLRYKWWKNRHFSKKMLQSEMAGGELSLMAYKAACATQMYGPRLYYVVKVGDFLKEEDGALFMVLNEYAHRVTGLLLEFSRVKTS